MGSGGGGGGGEGKVDECVSCYVAALWVAVRQSGLYRIIMAAVVLPCIPQ